MIAVNEPSWSVVTAAASVNVVRRFAVGVIPFDCSLVYATASSSIPN